MWPFFTYCLTIFLSYCFDPFLSVLTPFLPFVLTLFYLLFWPFFFLPVSTHFLLIVLTLKRPMYDVNWKKCIWSSWRLRSWARRTLDDRPCKNKARNITKFVCEFVTASVDFIIHQGFGGSKETHLSSRGLEKVAETDKTTFIMSSFSSGLRLHKLDLV